MKARRAKGGWMIGAALLASVGFSGFPVETAADLRVRYEHAVSDDTEDQSDAVTARGRVGAEVALDARVAVLIEGEVGGGLGTYDDGEGVPEPRPTIADPEFAGINRALVSWRPSDAITVKAGRQRLALDDERFVGALDFRNDDRTLDAVRATVRPGGGVTLDVTALGGASRPLRPRGRARWLRGSGLLLNANMPTPIGQLTGYRYALDLDADGLSVPGGATRTQGVRLAGASDRLRWTGEYARQDDRENGGDLRYAATTLSRVGEDVDVLFGWSSLGGDGEGGFQTPLGTNHAFQGSADLFLTTPPDGVRDANAQLTARFGEAGALRGASGFIRAHRFEAATGGATYGHELDIGVGGTLDGIRLTMEAAFYRADGFGADTTRVWLTASRRF